MDHHQPLAERGALAGLDRTAGDVNQPVAVALDQAPAGAAEPRIDAEDANRGLEHASCVAPRPGDA